LDKNEIGVSINVIKEKENFMVEAIGEDGENSSFIQEKKILCAIGEIVHGIAIPKSYFKLLKDFDIGGIQLLDFHFFIVENWWSLYHLDSKATIELIQDLKAGKPERLLDLDIDFKNYDYPV